MDKKNLEREKNSNEKNNTARENNRAEKEIVAETKNTTGKKIAAETKNTAEKKIVAETKNTTGKKITAETKDAAGESNSAEKKNGAKKKNTGGKKVAYCAVLVALAMIFSYIEAILPIHFGIPGVKLGLANLVVVTGFYYLRPGEVLLISLTRILLASLLFGNGVSLIYSLAGGMFSFLVMLGSRKVKGLSVVGVSISGGVSHNIGQVAAAAWIIKSRAVLYYLPVLMAAGVVAGMLMGILAARILPVIRRTGKNSIMP